MMDYANTFYPKILINNVDLTSTIYDAEERIIKIPIANYAQEVLISITDSEGQDVIVPYNVTIYAADCLGPHPITDPGMIAVFGGDMSCCDTPSLLDENNIPYQRNFVNNIIKNSGTPLNAEAYFCRSFDKDWFDQNSVLDYEKEIIWQPDIEATSVYSGNIIAKCKGEIPSVYGNLNGVYANDRDVNTYIHSIKLGNQIDEIHGEFPKLPFELKIETPSDEECEFCVLPNATYDLAFFTEEGITYELGFKGFNPGIGSDFLKPIPEDPEYSNVLVKCKNYDTYINTGSGWNIEPNFFSKNSNHGNVEIGINYCSQGIVDCETKIVASFNDLQCTDYWYDNGESDLIGGPNNAVTWICNTYTVNGNPICNTNTHVYDCEDVQYNTNCDTIHANCPSNSHIDDPDCGEIC